jgi:hypothetical protein
MTHRTIEINVASMNDNNWQSLAAEAKQRMESAQRLLAQPSVTEIDQLQLLKAIRALAEAASNAGIGTESESSFREKIADLDKLIADIKSKPGVK